MKIINLISGPRNISTAVMYSFGRRDDTRVVDEPFYALYLLKTGLAHPGREEIMLHQSTDENEIRKQISAHKEPVVFVKNMAHHMEILEHPFIDGAINIFLIRNPAQIVASYAQVIENPVMRDIGIEYQFRLFTALKESGGDPVVLDTGLLLKNPASILGQLCQRCAIGYTGAMLSWAPGPKPYDGVWAKYWYRNVHQSVGFAEQETSNRPLPGHLLDLVDRANRYYENLLPFSLKA